MLRRESWVCDPRLGMAWLGCPGDGGKGDEHVRKSLICFILFHFLEIRCDNTVEVQYITNGIAWGVSELLRNTACMCIMHVLLNIHWYSSASATTIL